MANFQKVYNKWSELNSELAKTSKEYIISKLEEIPGQRIEIDTEDNPVCVTYDGGNHPEYYADPFATVYAVYLKNGSIMLELEETDEYDISNVDACDVYTVADAVQQAVGEKVEYYQPELCSADGSHGYSLPDELHSFEVFHTCREAEEFMERLGYSEYHICAYTNDDIEDLVFLNAAGERIDQPE